jgi:hypothetical protein
LIQSSQDRILKKIYSLAAAAFCIFALSGAFCSGSGGDFDTYAAGSLSGANEVPPVATAHSGTFRLELHKSKDEGSVDVFTNIPDGQVVGAHLHVGIMGENGPVILDLMPGGASSLVKKFTASDFTGNGGITTWDQFLNALTLGQIYVNVHTNTHPSGEVRGQLPGIS